MPLSGIEDVQQSCVGFTSTFGSFYYQYAGNSNPSGTGAGEMLKYTATTDTWVLGNATRFRTPRPPRYGLRQRLASSSRLAVTVGEMRAGQKAPKAGLSYVASAAYASSPTAATFIYQLDGFYPLYTWVSTMKYNTATDSWTSVKKIPTVRALSSNEQAAMAATAASNIYVMGGGSAAGNVPAKRLTHEMYSPLTDAWTTKANMPAGYVGAAIGVWANTATTGTILVTGGYPATVTMHLYDAAQDAWRAGTRAHNGPCVSTAG
jgi:hypothetical protein